MTLSPVSQWASFGGTLSVHDHESALLGCKMRFAVFSPEKAEYGFMYREEPENEDDTGWRFCSAIDEDE
ncbi:MAG: DUF2185 domain-containing protein, partial [Pseudomonadota bacterium]